MTKEIALIAGSSALTTAAMAAQIDSIIEEPAAAMPSRQQGKTAAMVPNDGEGIPNRLSIVRSSPYYTSAGFCIGVVFNGEDVTGRVVEYNRSMGWVRLVDGPPGSRVSDSEARSAPMLHGTVQTYWRATPSRQVRRQLARIS